MVKFELFNYESNSSLTKIWISMCIRCLTNTSCNHRKTEIQNIRILVWRKVECNSVAGYGDVLSIYCISNAPY